METKMRPGHPGNRCCSNCEEEEKGCAQIVCDFGIHLSWFWYKLFVILIYIFHDFGINCLWFVIDFKVQDFDLSLPSPTCPQLKQQHISLLLEGGKIFKISKYQNIQISSNMIVYCWKVTKYFLFKDLIFWKTKSKTFLQQLVSSNLHQFVESFSLVFDSPVAGIW